MSRTFILCIILSICFSEFSGQTIGVSEKDLIGCWEKTNSSNAETFETFFPCKSKFTNQVMKFNNYGEYSIYFPSNGKCGTSSVISYGRFLFNVEDQILKLIDREKQKILVWRVSKNDNGSITIIKN